MNNSTRQVSWPEGAEAMLVEKIQVLWDSNDELDTRKPHRRKQLEELAACIMQQHPDLILTPDDVCQKFNHLKSHYDNEKNKLVTSSGSSDAASPPSKHEWFKLLSLLYSGTTPGPGETHLAPGDESVATPGLGETYLTPGDESVMTPGLGETHLAPGDESVTMPEAIENKFSLESMLFNEHGSSMNSSTRVFWPQEAEATLIEKIRDYPALWDNNHELYAKKLYRREQLKDLAAYIMKQHPDLILTPDDVRIKFNNLKTYYIREKKKQMKPSGSCATPSKWEWFNLLSFIDSVITSGPSESNLGLEESVTAPGPSESNLSSEESQLCNEHGSSFTSTIRVFWPREAEATLIEKIRDYPVLWDNNHKLYAKKLHRRKQLKSVAAYIMKQHPDVSLTPDDVRIKFNNLKTYYLREKKKQMRPSWSGIITPSKWEWFNLLSFIDSDTAPGPSENKLGILESLVKQERCGNNVSPECSLLYKYNEHCSSLNAGTTKKIFWPREAEATLIKTVQEYPILWDNSHELYSKKQYRREQLEEIAAYITKQHPDLAGIVTHDDVRIKFSNLKTYYIREKKKQVPPSKWEWFKLLSFLDCNTTPSEDPLHCNEGVGSEDACVVTVDEEDMYGWETDDVDSSMTDDAAVPATSSHFNSAHSSSSSRHESTPRKKKKNEHQERTR